MIPEFDQKSWDDRLMSAKTEEEWEVVNNQMQAAWNEYDKQVAADAEKNPEHYTTHQDKNGKLYTLNPDGSRKYREMRICQQCGERNEVDHDSWWDQHMEAHEVKRKFDLQNDPMIKRLKKYAGEHWYGPLHVRRWNQILTALGVDTSERAMTLDEAKWNYRRFSKARWGPPLERLRKMHTEKTK